MPDEEKKIDRIAELEWYLLREIGSHEVIIKLYAESHDGAQLVDNERALAACEIGLDMIAWMRKEKRKRMVQGYAPDER